MKRFEAFLQAPTAILIVARDGRILEANERGARMFGYTREEMRKLPVEALVPESLRHRHVALRASFHEDARPRPMGEGRDLCGVRADGTTFPLSIGLGPIELDSGPAVMVVVEDLTMRVAALEQVQELSELLSEQVATLSQSEASLLRANQELEQFAWAASHDLKTPLRTITSFASVLQDAEQLSPDGAASVEHIRKAALRMSEMLDGMLELLRAGSRARPFRPVDLEEAIEMARTSLASSLADSGAELVVDDLPIVLGDHLQLGQVFQNLVSNALKYHRPGEPPRIHIHGSLENGHARVCVDDHGLGIPASQREHVFNLFARLHRHAEVPGSGVGLPLCKQIVLRHHGQIHLEDGPEGGTSVVLTLRVPST